MQYSNKLDILCKWRTGFLYAGKSFRNVDLQKRTLVLFVVMTHVGAMLPFAVTLDIDQECHYIWNAVFGTHWVPLV